MEDNEKDEEMSDSLADSEEDFFEPKGKVVHSKSKVNCYQIYSYECTYFFVFQGKEIFVSEDVDWKEQCQNLLNTLNDSKDSVIFRQPVDILDKSGNRQVIDLPIDLKTVGEKLKVGNYATPNDFAMDVRLIFENLKKFNPIRKLRKTIRFSILFEDQFHEILDSYKRRKAAVKSKFKTDK